MVSFWFKLKTLRKTASTLQKLLEIKTMNTFKRKEFNLRVWWLTSKT